MIFELVSWTYITLVCFLCGNRIYKLIPGHKDDQLYLFPVICFIGMSVFGIVSFYLSLVTPLFTGFKIGLQIIPLLFLLRKHDRQDMLFQLKNVFKYFTKLGLAFLMISVLMILVISSAPIIHPDTLNYHAFSTEIFEQYGVLPGIANLKSEFGFQSMWFAALSFFHFSFRDHLMMFPLNGCVMVWVIVFLISGSSGFGQKINALDGIKRIWFLALILFAFFSWTQIRLTASSLSPDFITSISVLLAFYFFIAGRNTEDRKKTDFLASFFAGIAVSVKLSAIPVLLIPIGIAVYWISKKSYRLPLQIGLLLTCTLSPVIVRNFISTGYPVFPSTAAAVFKTDWKVPEGKVLDFQKYITAYARFPVLRINAIHEYNISLSEWLPMWWKHLYVIDQALILVAVAGLFFQFVLWRKIRLVYSGRQGGGLLVAVAGTVFWFVEAPDPRFGTGFIIALIYFLYSPLVSNPAKSITRYLDIFRNRVMQAASILVLLYTGYRVLHFFHPEQILLPEGIRQISAAPDDCDAKIKNMILSHSLPFRPLEDSCMFFKYRGETIRQGFRANE